MALEKLERSTRVTVDGIRSVSGTPFHECVATLLPELNPASEEIIEFIDEYERLGIETVGGELYPGVAQGLSDLAETYPLFLVSNCPDWYLDAFFRISGLREHFTAWDCHGASGVDKAAMLARLADEHGLERPAYVGDTHGDRRASELAGMDFVFVSYGFGRTEAPLLAFSAFPALAAHFLG